jgi:hypothetical protein
MSQPEFDQAYYQEFCQGHGQYDVVRPLRRGLKQTFLPLPDNATISDFAIGFVGNFAKWGRLFSTVYGYDINPEVGKQAEAAGIGDFFFLQDVAEPFEPQARTHVCVCFYLFEHLDDAHVLTTIANMVKTAPINIIGLTPVTDQEHYLADPTHCNPKTRRTWGTMLTAAYKKGYGWKRLHSVGNYWTFVSAAVDRELRSLHGQVGVLTQRMWINIEEAL